MPSLDPVLIWPESFSPASELALLMPLLYNAERARRDDWREAPDSSLTGLAGKVLVDKRWVLVE